jgi:hypothetical protein
MDIESVSRLIADNVAIKYGFKITADNKADEGGQKVLRGEIAACDMMDGRFVEEEERKRIKLVIRFLLEHIGNETNDGSAHTRPVRREWVTAPGNVSTSTPNPAAKLNMSAVTKQVEKKMATKETPGAGKIPSSNLESPISPKNSPDVRSSAADSLLILKLR